MSPRRSGGAHEKDGKLAERDAKEEEERERRFWRSLRQREGAGERTSAPASATLPLARTGKVPQEPTDAPVSPEAGEPLEAHRLEARRLALRALLDAAEARIDRAGRARRPVLAEGAVVRATRGELAGRTAVVLDADYIESRVLLDLGPGEPHRWVPFSHVGAAESGE